VTPLPALLGGSELVIWRLDTAPHAATWDSGEGAYLFGGRWNSRGHRVVYCSLDASTATLEVAVHKGFDVLDRVPHVLTSAVVLDPADVFIVEPEDIPNANWLRPGQPSAGQQAFGDGLLVAYPFVAIPSAVSPHSWNLLISIPGANGRYSLRAQERYALDTRLNAPLP